MKKNLSLLLLLLIIGCQNQPQLHPYYKANSLVALRFDTTQDSIKGSLIQLGAKDSLEIAGILKDSLLEFHIEPKEHKHNQDFYYEGYRQGDSLVIFRYFKRTNGEIYIPLYFHPISKFSYDTLVENYFNPLPIQLITAEKDTILGDFEFHFKVKDWSPNKHFVDTEIIVRETHSQKILQKIETNRVVLDEDFSFDYEDVNFDGYPDLVFPSSMRGGYGTMIDDYFLYHPDKKQFIFSEELAELSSCMGIEIDTIQKRIISYAKDGCCWHQEKAYKPSKDKFIEIKSLTIVENIPESLSYILLKYKENGKWKTYKRLLKNLPESTVDSLYENF